MKRELGQKIILLLLGHVFVSSLAARADDSISPYIDKLRREQKEQEEPRTNEAPDPYIQSIKSKLDPNVAPQSNDANPQLYIDSLKKDDPTLNVNPEQESFTEEQKAKLGPPDTESAIQKVAEGRSNLQLKRPGPVTGSVGLKIGTVVNHSFTGSAPVVVNNFTDVYGNNWAPDFSLIVEYKIFHHEDYASFGILGELGAGIFKGSGLFAIQLQKPNGSNFPSASLTKMTFISIPVTLGPKVQLNMSKYFRPYAIVGVTAIGMAENRNDGVGSRRALSKGVTTTGGAAIPMDWLSGGNSWDLYQDFSIKHYYFTVEYTKLTSIASPVDVSYSGVDMGFTFDF